VSGLPKGWAQVPLGKFAAKTKNLDPSKFPTEIFELYSVPSFSTGLPEVVPGSEIKSSKQIVLPGDVLLCKIVPHINRVWTVPSLKKHRQIASGEWIVYRDHGCEPHYLCYCLSEGSFREQFLSTVAGVGGSLMRARPSEVEKIQVPIPSLPEQRRIVAKLDNLTGSTARTREQLGRIPKLIQKYREAILAAAFTGELTREWRHIYPSSPIVRVTSKAPIDGRAADLETLPDTWAWTAFGNTSLVSGGLTKNSKREALPFKVPYLRVANVYANELRLDEISEIGCTPAELSKTRLQSGDLLIVEGNGSIDQIGRVAIWASEIEGCSHQNHIIRARMSAGFDPKYALFWLISPAGRHAIERVASSSSGLHTLSISKVSSLPFPICGMLEQQEIVRRIETAFAWLDRVAVEHANASRLLPRLDQAILAKAFRGELTTRIESTGHEKV